MTNVGTDFGSENPVVARPPGFLLRPAGTIAKHNKCMNH